jgi:hypothetical protein
MKSGFQKLPLSRPSPQQAFRLKLKKRRVTSTRLLHSLKLQAPSFSFSHLNRRYRVKCGDDECTYILTASLDNEKKCEKPGEDCSCSG